VRPDLSRILGDIHVVLGNKLIGLSLSKLHYFFVGGIIF
jgi:hypothetical protein